MFCLCLWVLNASLDDENWIKFRLNTQWPRTVHIFDCVCAFVQAFTLFPPSILHSKSRLCPRDQPYVFFNYNIVSLLLYVHDLLPFQFELRMRSPKQSLNPIARYAVHRLLIFVGQQTSASFFSFLLHSLSAARALSLRAAPVNPMLPLSDSLRNCSVLIFWTCFSVLALFEGTIFSQIPEDDGSWTTLTKLGRSMVKNLPLYAWLKRILQQFLLFPSLFIVLDNGRNTTVTSLFLSLYWFNFSLSPTVFSTKWWFFIILLSFENDVTTVINA